jgi:hypothetical protein
MSKPSFNGDEQGRGRKNISDGDTVRLILGILLVLFFLAAGIISFRESSTVEKGRSIGPVRNPKALNKIQNSSCLPLHYNVAEKGVGSRTSQAA